MSKEREVTNYFRRAACGRRAPKKETSYEGKANWRSAVGSSDGRCDAWLWDKDEWSLRFFLRWCYVDKADFGTGHIELHEFNMPDMDWDAIKAAYQGSFGE